MVADTNKTHTSLIAHRGLLKFRNLNIKINMINLFTQKTAGFLIMRCLCYVQYHRNAILIHVIVKSCFDSVWKDEPGWHVAMPERSVDFKRQSNLAPLNNTSEVA